MSAGGRLSVVAASHVAALQPQPSPKGTYVFNLSPHNTLRHDSHANAPRMVAMRPAPLLRGENPCLSGAPGRDSGPVPALGGAAASCFFQPQPQRMSTSEPIASTRSLGNWVVNQP